jgi:EAL domain-containing protein (putative c-di-GMP-specific phosphodiesterase class I)
MPVTLSIGVVPIDRATVDAHEVLAAADDALHLAKEEGGNRINVFDNAESKYRKRRGEMEWIGKINGAIEDDRFLLYFQTIEPLVPHPDRPPKAEILVRMVNEDGGIARPMDFIPAAERYNLMPAIDRWVIRESFKAYRRHRDSGGALAGRGISINLSGPSLLDESLIRFILDEREAAGVPADRLCLEVTETAAIQNLAHATRFMTALKDEGFSFALDDFGSGFSSFAYLRSLPVDFLKIDGGLVSNVDESEVSAAMVGSINTIGHVMGIKTIAEFVGSVPVRDKVTSLGVDYGQGYVFSEPVPVDPK